MLNKLRKINDLLINKYRTEENFKKLSIQLNIKKLLTQNDCFFKMSIEQAFTVLRELDIKKENFENIYLELTKPKN